MTDLTAITEEQIQDGIEVMAEWLGQGHTPQSAALHAARKVCPTHRGTWRPYAARVTRQGNLYRALLASFADAHQGCES